MFFHTKDACWRDIRIQETIFPAETPAFFVIIWLCHFIIIPLWKKTDYECSTILESNKQPLCDTNHAPHSLGCALGNTAHLVAPSLPQFGFPPCCLAPCPECRYCRRSWENLEEKRKNLSHSFDCGGGSDLTHASWPVPYVWLLLGQTWVPPCHSSETSSDQIGSSRKSCRYSWQEESVSPG